MLKQCNHDTYVSKKAYMYRWSLPLPVLILLFQPRCHLFLWSYCACQAHFPDSSGQMQLCPDPKKWPVLLKLLLVLSPFHPSRPPPSVYNISWNLNFSDVHFWTTPLPRHQVLHVKEATNNKLKGRINF